MEHEKNEIDELYNKIIRGDQSVLKNYRFTLWINFLGPRTSYREFRLHQVDDVELFAIYGFKLLITGDQLLRYITAFEIARNVFIHRESASEEDWKKLIEMIVKNNKPRIIFNEQLRSSLGLPNNIADLDVYILSIMRFE